MIISIPSRSRAKDIGNRTLRYLPASWHTRTYVHCPESEETAYRVALKPFPGVTLCTVPDEWRLARKRPYQAEHARSVGHESFVICDDDVQFFIRKSDTVTNLRNAEPEEVSDMFDFMETMLANGPYSHIGVSAREGNNRFGCDQTRYNLTVANTRLMRVVGWRVDDMIGGNGKEPLIHNRVDARSDFDHSLQSLRRGRKNLLLAYWTQNQVETGDAGGCSVYRTVELANEMAHKLVELHPGFVTLRQKVNKSGGMRERTEVTIYWQKAFKSSCA